MNLLVIDTETGGLDPTVHSVLSLGAVVYPYAPGALEFSELIKEQPFVVDGSALHVNKIDLAMHSRVAASPVAVWAAFLGFVRQQTGLFRVYGKVVLAGHNVPFDIGFLRRLHRLANDSTPFEEYFSHRFIDTMAIGLFMQLCGSPIKKLGLADLLTFFGLKNDAAHTALGDARATAMLLEKMRETAQVGRLAAA